MTQSEHLAAMCGGLASIADALLAQGFVVHAVVRDSANDAKVGGADARSDCRCSSVPECKLFLYNALFLPYIVISLYGGGNVIIPMM